MRTEQFKSGSNAGPNGVVLQGAVANAPTVAIGATGQVISTGNSSLNSIGVLLALKPASGSPVDHYELSQPSTGITCLASTLTVKLSDGSTSRSLPSASCSSRSRMASD